MDTVKILKPDSASDREKHERNAAQLERRRLAHDLMCAYVQAGASLDGEYVVEFARNALRIADELLSQTKLED